MQSEFHLSIGVKSIEASINFFENILKAEVTHRDPSYVNIHFYGTQITLKENQTANSEIPDFHFGANLPLQEFDDLAEHILKTEYSNIIMRPKVVDAGTPMERKKMYLKCPTGYLIEVKGYKNRESSK